MTTSEKHHGCSHEPKLHDYVGHAQETSQRLKKHVIERKMEVIVAGCS